MDQQAAGIVIAVITLLGVVAGGLIGLRKVHQVHVLVNSNMAKVRLDVRLLLICIVFIAVTAITALFKGQQDGAARERKKG